MESGLNGSTVLLAVALGFLFEGLILFAFPASWRRAYLEFIRLSDGQLRAVGLFCLSLALALIWWLT